MTTRGLIFLDDLYAFGPWISDRAPGWARSRELAGELLEPTAIPPPVIVVVARALAWDRLESSAAWLAMARWVVIVLDGREQVTPPEGMTDEEVAELLALERAQLVEALEQRVTFVEVAARGARAGDGGDEALEGAIDQALELAAQRAAQPETGATDRAAEGSSWPSPVKRAPRRNTVAPGPWISWSPPTTRASGFEEEEALRHLAAGMCWTDAGPAVLDVNAGERIDLGSGERTAIAGLTGAQRWRPVAAHPGGARWLRGEGGKVERWWLEGVDGPGPEQKGGWGQVIGVDPGGQLAWTGGRCYFQWRVLTERGPVRWTPSSHGWPSGHSKKLYGYKDNDPLYVQLSADGSTCLSVYEHDSLITPGLPLRWRGLGGLALGERMRGEPRALLFERPDGEDRFPADPYDAHDEDARDRRAVVTLGPNAELRYVVGLGAPVYRVLGDEVTRLEEPQGGGGWCVFDSQHRLVRRGSGRLLTGWDRWVVIEEEGQLRREDLLGGERQPLGEVEHPIAFAHAFAGSANALLASLVPGGDDTFTGGRIRLV